jgi:hypothetical protein
MKVIDAKETAASTDHDPLEKGLSKSVILTPTLLCSVPA